jgi:L-amino acid N-acyltransferase YncA
MALEKNKVLDEFHALILCSNAASRKLFEDVGFCLSEDLILEERKFHKYIYKMGEGMCQSFYSKIT